MWLCMCVVLTACLSKMRTTRGSCQLCAFYAGFIVLRVHLVVMLKSLRIVVGSRSLSVDAEWVPSIICLTSRVLYISAPYLDPSC